MSRLTSFTHQSNQPVSIHYWVEVPCARHLFLSCACRIHCLCERLTMSSDHRAGGLPLCLRLYQACHSVTALVYLLCLLAKWVRPSPLQPGDSHARLDWKFKKYSIKLFMLKRIVRLFFFSRNFKCLSVLIYKAVEHYSIIDINTNWRNKLKFKCRQSQVRICDFY